MKTLNCILLILATALVSFGAQKAPKQTPAIRVMVEVLNSPIQVELTKKLTEVGLQATFTVGTAKEAKKQMKSKEVDAFVGTQRYDFSDLAPSYKLQSGVFYLTGEWVFSNLECLNKVAKLAN